MRAVSAAWRRTITGSWTPITRITLCQGFQTGTNPTGDRLNLVDGSIHLDGAAGIYTTGRLTFPGELWPALIEPGAELYVATGIRYSDASIELVGLGYLRVRTPGQSDAQQDGPVEVAVEDRNTVLARADLLQPRTYAASTTYGDMAEDLVTDVFPDAEIEWDDDTDTHEIRTQVTVDGGRLDALFALAQAAGKTMRWNDRGALAFSTPANLLDDVPVTDLTAGRNGVLAKVAREVSDLDVVNAVIALGDGFSDDPAARGVAVDYDSPTAYNGPYGPAVRTIVSSLVGTDAQANTVARAELGRAAGLLHTVRWETSPRPELEPDDLIHIDHAHGVGRHAIAALDIPLLPGGRMSGITRQQELTVTGAR